MPFAEIRGKNVHYEVHGEGDPILLLHHGFSSGRMWDGIYPGLVAAGYKVIVYDRRGYGQSEPGADFEEFYVSDRYCEESVAELVALCDQLDVHSFNIVGQCEGGVVGVNYAGRFPDQVRALMISSTLCFSLSTIVEFNRLNFPLPFEELEPAMRGNLLRWHGPDRAEPLYELARIRGGAYGSGMFDLRPRLALVNCPTLVLYPDRSALFGVEQAVEFYRHLPKGELAVLPRCGHNTYQHYPKEYVSHVLNFLDRVSSATSAKPVDFSMTCLAPFPPGAKWRERE